MTADDVGVYSYPSNDELLIESQPGSQPASNTGVCAYEFYCTWAPLRHLTAGSSGTYQQQLQSGWPLVPAY